MENRKLSLSQLLKMNVEELMGLLPNNVCVGKGDSIGAIYSPKIGKNIEGKYFVEYSQQLNTTVYNERKILFEITYAIDIKVALAEALIRVEEIHINLINNQ